MNTATLGISLVYLLLLATMKCLFFTLNFVIMLYFFMESFDCNPCNYFYQFRAKEKQIEQKCNSYFRVPNAGNILDIQSVHSPVECIVKCMSFFGCKAVDYNTSRSIDNCLLFSYRRISGCLNNSAILHYEIVSTRLWWIWKRKLNFQCN